MADFLADELFGKKKAVSSTLLSLSKNIPLLEAEREMQMFYDSHRDEIHASYKVKKQEGIKTTVKVVNSADLEETDSGSTINIYMISPQNAADRAVIDDVTKRVQTIQFRTNIGNLETLGFVTNPFLSDNFVVDNELGFYGPLASQLQAYKPPAPYKAVPRPPPQPAKEVKKNEKKETKTPKAKKAGKGSMFTTITKDEAVKQTRKNQSRPSVESIIGDDNTIDEDEMQVESDQDPEHDIESIPESLPESVPEPDSVPETIRTAEAERKSEPESRRTGETANPAVKQEIGPEVKQEADPAAKSTKRVTKAKPFKQTKKKTSKQAPLGFMKVPKSEALKQTYNRNTIEKPVSEKVVIGDINENEGEEEEVQKTQPPKDEMKNLESLFDQPVQEVEDVEMDVPDRGPQPVPGNESDQDQDPEPLPSEGNQDQSPDHELHNTSGHKAGLEQQQNSQLDQKEVPNSRPSQHSQPKRFKRVLKRVEVVDEDGEKYTVNEYVNVPLDEGEEIGTEPKKMKLGEDGLKKEKKYQAAPKISKNEGISSFFKSRK